MMAGGRADARVLGTDDAEMAASHCGFVAIIGAPNAGKSTLVNRVVGAKVSIVTPKTQTTRFRVLGVAVYGRDQIILIDTPGIFAPKKRLERAMVAAAWGGAGDADEIVLVVDAGRGIDSNTTQIVERLRGAGRRAVLALNKIDLVAKQQLLSLAEALYDTGIIDAVFMVSALTGDGVDALVAHFRERLPCGPWLYPADQISDLPERVFATEITREKLFLVLDQELPYAASVETEGWKERPDGSTEIRQIINVQREGQKAIVIGHKGSRLGRIGSMARSDLERLFGRRVHLFLHVRVQQRRSDDRDWYREAGLDYDA